MNAVKIILKVVLILVGSLLLAGGGVCAATNVLLALPPWRGDLSLVFVFFGISVAVAAVGWLLLEVAGVGWLRKTRHNAPGPSQGERRTE